MDTKIVVIVRTRDEKDRIGQFCEAYEDADYILVGDGGSVDDTVSIATRYRNVIVSHYQYRVELKNGYWRNNDSDHTNWLIKWAETYEPDWIIFDDCDIRPNFLLKKYYRKILSETDADVVMAVRVYLYGTQHYLPKLSSPLGEEGGQASLYAWRGDLGLMTVDAFPHFTFKIGNKPIKEFRTDTKALELFYPYCLLHFNWDTEGHIEKKLKYYRESGLIPHMKHPLEFGGKLKLLEDFMRE